jgi:type I restriction enzyme S subunit
LVLFPKKNINANFLTEYINNRVKVFTESAGIPQLTGISITKYNIPLPSTLAEQEAIAQALTDTDALIESLEQLIAKKSQIKQGAMQELLTGKRRLQGFEVSKGYKQSEIGFIPQDWSTDFIENLAHITTGGKNTQDHVDDGQYPFFVRSQTVERINSYSFEGEAVLTAGDGVGTGKIYHYIIGRFDVHQRVYRISDFNQILNGYFFYLYFSNHFYNRIMQMTAKSSVDSVRYEMIGKMIIPLPSIEEQSAIATILSDMDTEIAVLEEKLEKSRSLKQGMMQELLTGRIRLE